MQPPFGGIAKLCFERGPTSLATTSLLKKRLNVTGTYSVIPDFPKHGNGKGNTRKNPQLRFFFGFPLERYIGDAAVPDGI